MQVDARGIEASLNWNFAPRWSLDANATVLKAEFEDFLETTGSPPMLVSRDGNVPPNVAERLASMWLSWQFAPDWSAAGACVMSASATPTTPIRWNCLQHRPGTDLAGGTAHSAVRAVVQRVRQGVLRHRVLHQYAVVAGCGPARRIHRRPSLEGAGDDDAFHRQALDLPGASLAGHRRMPADAAVVRQRHGDAVHWLPEADARRAAALPVLGEARDLQGLSVLPAAVQAEPEAVALTTLRGEAAYVVRSGSNVGAWSAVTGQALLPVSAAPKHPLHSSRAARPSWVRCA